MNNLEALDEMRDILDAGNRLLMQMRQDHAKPEPAPEYNLEAGCRVTHRPCGSKGIIRHVANSFVLVDTEYGTEQSWLATTLRVTAPATPEVGDYVAWHSAGTTAIVRRKSDDPQRGAWVLRAPSGSPCYVNRSEFTILAKAPKQMP